MFFTFKKKKISEELAIALSNTVRPPFALSEYLVDGVFKPPFGFWSDRYILGLLFTLANFFIGYDFGGEKWTAQKKGEILIGAFQKLTADWQQVFIDCQRFAVDRSDSEFKRGSDDAVAIYGIASGRLNQEEYTSNPLVVAAVKDANAMHNTMSFFNNGLSSDQAEIAASYAMLTLHKHIHEKYLPERAQP